MKKIKIPKKYVEIVKEKDKPTRYIMDKKTREMRGRLEKGDKRKKGFIYGKKAGRTRVIRMKQDYKGFKKGQVIARTKKQYPRQPNTVLVRGHIRRGKKLGKIRAISISKYKRKKPYK